MREPAVEISFDGLVEEEANSPRLALSRRRVQEFAGIMREQGASAFPPVMLAGPDESGGYAIIDGRHRIAAARLAGLASFPARVSAWSTERERFAAALRLSARDGLPLTNQERRRAVQRLLRDYPERSTRELARMAATSHELVARCKKEGALGEAGRRPERRASPGRLARRLLAAAVALGEAMPAAGGQRELALARKSHSFGKSHLATMTSIGLPPPQSRERPIAGCMTK